LGQSDSPASFADLGRILDSDPTLRSEFDCAFRIAAAAAAEKVSGQQRADLIELIHTESEPGFLALREALLKGWRRELRRSTTDITAQLMRRGGKGISATRGSVQFFELGQDLLLLLAKLVAGDEKVRYRDFLERLSLYGLAPQDREEEDVLADVLRSLQLLDKYSDTGEAMYVKHFL
jgi:DNA phosphorothioation-dependent restriction protein DptG